jgi:pimeloyl-ACP methyl ester carboxylesterase
MFCLPHTDPLRQFIAMRTSATRLVVDSAPTLRRAYFESRFGQLHVYQAIPAGGGFDEAVAVVCIPAVSSSGKYFQPLLAPLGRDRSVYAIDLPGTGQSDGPPQASPEQHASALADFLLSMRLPRVNLLAQASGSGMIAELCRLQPQRVGAVALGTGAVAPAGVAAARHFDLESLQRTGGSGTAALAGELRAFFDALQ